MRRKSVRVQHGMNSLVRASPIASYHSPQHNTIGKRAHNPRLIQFVRFKGRVDFQIAAQPLHILVKSIVDTAVKAVRARHSVHSSCMYALHDVCLACCCLLRFINMGKRQRGNDTKN